MIASLIKTKGQGRHEAEGEHKQHFEIATEEEMAQLEPVFGKRTKS